MLFNQLNQSKSSLDKLSACNRVLNVQVLRQVALVGRLEVLLLLSEALIAKVLLVLIFNLAANDVHSLVVVLVYWLGLLLALRRVLELSHCSGFILNGSFSKLYYEIKVCIVD